MCKIENCSNSVHVKKHNLCRAHYLRWKKYGDPLHFPEPRRGKDSSRYKHGAWGEELFKTWSHMIDRCHNPKCKAYKHYGKRGIHVCESWRNDFFQFKKDMGERPENTSIERIDNNKGYNPHNCKWATSVEQGRNRRCVKLTKEKADEMRSLPRRAKNGRGSGYSREDMAEKYGVSVATVKKVLSGAYWK
ncbi:MAG: hypothetical protein CMH22_15930 [Methylophaga sp.]|nr:hypothetical protein [Methylophaga sp.]MAX53465.1 hypothetical protein [Methylophaga sp.]|tara:strand:+ start:89 stop:658 length:570 start_codon:yes stop_codon:yes gene_type:complete